MKNLESLKQIASVIYGQKEEGIKVIAADKTFDNYTDFINSEELKEVHSGFQSKTSIKESMFDYAWVVGKDVFVKYKADGLNFIKKECVGSSLDNGGLYYCIAVYQGFIVDTRITYDKGEENRNIWRSEDFRVLISPLCI